PPARGPAARARRPLPARLARAGRNETAFDLPAPPRSPGAEAARRSASAAAVPLAAAARPATAGLSATAATAASTAAAATTATTAAPTAASGVLRSAPVGRAPGALRRV